MNQSTPKPNELRNSDPNSSEYPTPDGENADVGEWLDAFKTVTAFQEETEGMF